MRRRVIVPTLALTLSALLLTSFTYGQLNNTLRVSFIDVGQGDSIWLHASDDADILIDGGRRSAGPTVVAHLQAEGIDDIDVLILSHGDADHIGGLIDVLQSAITVESVIYNGQHRDTSTYLDLLAEMQARGLTPTPAQIGQAYTWGEVDASVLNPQETPTGDQNEDSVVMIVTYGDTDFLFSGDIGESAEQTILDSGTPVAAEVLKVAHHGSKYSSSADFLEAVGVEVGVISVGDNPYGHPTDETLNRLRAAGARILRTDRRGTITVTTDGQTYEVTPDFLVFLPLAARMAGSVPTETPPLTTGNIVITDLFYDGVAGRQEPDEYVEIRNDDDRAIQLSGWTLRDEANHVFTFPNHVMQPGERCRVYTNEYHPESCGFSYGSGSAIWNNSGDCAELRDGYGDTIGTYCY